MLEGTFRNPTEVLFGPGGVATTASRLKGMAARVLIVHGCRSYLSFGLAAAVQQALTAANISYVEFGGIRANPVAESVYRGIDVCRSYRPDAILAVGGASVIDVAKAIGIGAVCDHDFFDFFERKRSPIATLPIATLLTIFGAGSESSDSSVIDKAGCKYACSSPVLFPVFSVLDPSLTRTVPPFLLASGIFDSFCHVLERYFTRTPDVRTSTHLCLALMKMLADAGPALVTTPENDGLRGDLMWAAKLAHDNTLGFGRKGDWATHAIAHEIGARCHRPHGAILAVLFPAWMEFIHRSHPQLLNQLGAHVFGIPDDDPHAASQETIRAVRSFAGRMGLPSTLRELGFPERTAWKSVAAACCRINPSGTIGNFVRLGPSEILDILHFASGEHG